jgi:putative aldouronate transport system permease protein
MRASKLRKNSTKGLWLRIRRNWELYLLLLPAVVLLICFTYRPMYGVLLNKAYRSYI